MVGLWVPALTDDRPAHVSNASRFSIVCFNNILLRTASWDGKKQTVSVTDSNKLPAQRKFPSPAVCMQVGLFC